MNPYRFRIDVSATTTTVHFGKIGCNGTVQEKEHESVEEAHKYAEKQTRDKIKKGYEPVKKQSAKKQSKRKSPASGKSAPDSPDVPTVPLSMTHPSHQETQKRHTCCRCRRCCCCTCTKSWLCKARGP